MKFQLVNKYPKFRRTCYQCNKNLDSNVDDIWADLEGPAFVAYYCDSCKKETEAKIKSGKYILTDLNGGQS